MFVCSTCKREMRCDKNGIGVRWRGCHVYWGDRYKCPKCGATVINTNGTPTHEDEARHDREYLDMD